METVKEYKKPLLVAAALAVLIGGVVLWNGNRSTDSDKKGADSSEQKKTVEKKPAAKSAPGVDIEGEDGSYGYVAQAGDSYSVLARKAVQAFASDLKLSQGQIIAAETTLTLGAGSPELNLGQQVEIKKTEVEAAVKQAQQLSAADVAAWETYAPYVNFDTSSNGQ